MAAHNLLDITGQAFGYYVVISRVSPKTGRREAYWLCRCICGTERRVVGTELRSGHVKSCGCKKAELVSQNRRIHGYAPQDYSKRRTEYKIWKGMKQRCYDPKFDGYGNYGGRGITVCDRWRHDFVAFFADMGPRPPKLTLERIDNDGNYEPGNCKWATRSEQRLNARKPCR